MDISISEIMDPVLQAHLARTAEEKEKYPPLKIPGAKGNKKVAICGLASTTRHMAPFTDPTWDVWTMHMGVKLLPRVDLLFETHDPLFEKYEKDYTEVLKALTIPVFMQKHYEEFPTSIEFPIKEFTDQFGRFFTNTVSYMIALAIRQRYERIDLYGVEMEHETEYVSQARSVIYFIGLAEGRGIVVGMPHACQLMKNRWLYGFETAQQDEVIQRIDKHESELAQQRSQMEAQLSSLQAGFHQITGSIAECAQIRRRILLAE